MPSYVWQNNWKPSFLTVAHWKNSEKHPVHQSPRCSAQILLQFHILKKLYSQRMRLWNVMKIRPSYHEANATSTITKYSNRLDFHFNVQETFISILTKRAPLGAGQTLKITPCSITKGSIQYKGCIFALLASETSETKAWYLNLTLEIIMLPNLKYTV